MHALSLCFAALLLATAHAQHLATVEETVDRKLTRVAWLDHTGAAHQIWIDYGQPEWRPGYGQLAARAGRYQLGRDAWTTLYANLSFRIGDTEIAPGLWHVGIVRGEDGAWSLLLFAGARILTTRMPATRVAQLDPDLVVPLAHERTDTSESLLRIELRAQRDEPGRAHLQLAWGDHRLRADLRARLELPPPPQFPQFERPDALPLRTTPSGLRYQVILAGSGEVPGPRDTAHIHYALWRDDGTEVDSSYGRADGPIGFPLDRVIEGMREGLALMKPGAQFRFVIPPELAYGESAPAPIGPHATLVFLVELERIERAR